ncbi:MAG: helix-turn-helix domain-containing protein [Gemmatimonas sp.]|nr:helix-turn-helix domain-containing protein [Gemmatimonas sp.]
MLQARLEGAMHTDLLRALRTIADALPPGSSVTLEGGWLRAQLEEVENGSTQHKAANHRLADLTVEQVAEELGRSGSTVRGWLAAAEFPNAFKLNQREWRIPLSDVRAFLDRQRPQTEKWPESARLRRSSRTQDDLGSWRQQIGTRR